MICAENSTFMKKYFVYMMLVAGVLMIASCEGKKNQDASEVADEQNEEVAESADLEKDAEFAVDATDAGLFEVQLATLAKKKAYSARVKEFADMMIADHTKANDELRDLAGKKGIALPDVMCEDCQKKYYDLDQKTTGEEFDKEYMDLMVKDHKDAIDQFEDEAKGGNDGEMKLWASGKVPALRHHLQEAENIRESISQNNN